MRAPFTKLELAGAVLLVGGPILYFTASQLSLRESVEGNASVAIGNSMKAMGDSMLGTTGVGELTQALGRVSTAMGENGERMLLHNSRAHTWARVANGGYVLFLLGVGLFLFGLRQRFLALAGGAAQQKDAEGPHATPDAP